MFGILFHYQQFVLNTFHGRNPLLTTMIKFINELIWTGIITTNPCIRMTVDNNYGTCETFSGFIIMTTTLNN